MNETLRLNHQGDTVTWSRRTELVFHDAPEECTLEHFHLSLREAPAHGSTNW